jgi:hypothetical protein
VLKLRNHGADVVVRYRLTAAQVTVPTLVGGLLGIGLGMFGDWRSGLPVWEPFDLGLIRDLLMLCVTLLVMVRVVAPAAVTLTPYGVRVSGWRARTVGWPEIASVTVAGGFPGFRLVTLTTFSGKRIRLPAPVSYLDPRFTKKADAIRARWTASRLLGPDTTGLMAPAPRNGHGTDPG